MLHHSRRTFLTRAAATLAIARTSLTSRAASTLPQSTPQPPPLGTIRAAGDLAHRTAQNFGRLQADLYRPPQIFRGTNWQAWPGDMEGRALLAITLLSRSTGSEPDYFPAMVAAYPAQLNPQGYFGPALDLHAINEQQLSGHGWFLRGLCEYYDYKHDPATLAQIRTIIRNLALPLRGSYATYPSDPALRTRLSAKGGVDGHLAAEHNNWAISTDTGCAFIFLDGLTHAWVTLLAASAPEAPALKSLIDEAIARFLQVDLIAIQAQTHATLTALRALLRVYGETHDATLLAAVESRYQLYRTSAFTEHYANYNWFGRPDSWTEPCAIIDSFMIATQLWQHTAKPAYLEDAHLIWTNGVGRGMRANGGFGTDTCAGAKSPFLKVRSYEAFFCCTMRGGEGHARAIQYLYQTRTNPAGQPELTLPFYSDSEAHLTLSGPHSATLSVRQSSAYPYPGPTRLEVLATSLRAPLALCLFAPTWTSAHRVALNDVPLPHTIENGFLTVHFTPKAGDILTLDQTLAVAARNPLNSATLPGYYGFQAGPILLGYTSATTPLADTPAASDPTAPAPRRAPAPNPPEVHIPRNAVLTLTAPGQYQIQGTAITLSRINDLNDSSATPRDPCTRQILFRPA